jgi:hypothetical protein
VGPLSVYVLLSVLILLSRLSICIKGKDVFSGRGVSVRATHSSTCYRVRLDCTKSRNFRTVTHNTISTIIQSFSPYIQKCVNSSYALSRMRQTPVRFTSHYRTVDPQYESYFKAYVLCLQFGGSS